MTAIGSPGGDRLASRRAVEALRSGVPSRFAVSALGTGQPDIEDAFTDLVDGLGTRRGKRGLLIGGGFGSGKSHLLEHLALLALDQDIVVSRVVVSKETPLHDPAKVLRAAVESAVLPGGAGGAVAESAAMLDPGSTGYAELLAWAGGSQAVDERFPLTLKLLPRVQTADAEFAEAIVRFWAGDPLAVAALRRQAREAGIGRASLPAVPVRELARQRFRFLARLFVAAGAGGWVLLFDEVELVGRYTPLQRGRAYAELAGWLRADPEDPGSPLASVVAMTDDFDAAVLTEKDDRTAVPTKLRAKQTPEYDAMAARAEDGIRAIEREMRLLSAPDDAELDRAYRQLKALHGEAFGWDPPDVAGLQRLGATRMRQYVRAWINEWDLTRIDPAHLPDIETVEVPASWAESRDLEGDP